MNSQERSLEIGNCSGAYQRWFTQIYCFEFAADLKSVFTSTLLVKGKSKISSWYRECTFEFIQSGKSTDTSDFNVGRMYRVVPSGLDYTCYQPTYAPITFNGEAKNRASTNFKL